MTIASSASTGTGRRLGQWALILALVAVIWPALTTVGVILGLGDIPEAARIVVVIVFFVGWLLVPLAAVGALVLGVIALLRNARTGRILAIVAIALIVLLAVTVAVLGANGVLGTYST